MEVNIRRAEPRDVPRMLELVKELAVFERAPTEVTVTQEHMHDAGFGTDPVWVGWVAEIRSADGAISELANGALVGMSVCYERYSTWKGRRLYLEDIIVTEAVRGQRIGEKLFRECARYAMERDHDGMTWQVLDWNKDAVRFYERFGAGFSKEWWNGFVGRDQLKSIAAG